MDGTFKSEDIFAELDGSLIVGSWRPDLSRALLELEASLSTVDRQILSPLCDAVARNASVLSSEARSANRASPMSAPAGIYAGHPSSSTLLAFLHSPVDGLQLLGAIGLCALLGSSGNGRDAPARLLTVVRGGLRSGSALSGALGAIRSIPELIRVIETDGPTRASLPKSFMAQWEQWLHAKLVHWILTDTSGVRHALEPSVLVPELSGIQIPVAVHTGLPDEAAHVSAYATPPVSVEGPYTTQCTDWARAEANALGRQSVGDLFAPSGFRLPASLDEHICRAAVARAHEELAKSAESAAPFICVALLLGGGLREIDLPTVIWGGPDQAQSLTVALDAPVLHRPVKRPGGAVKPPANIAGLLESSSDVFASPLPPSVHSLLLQLAGGAPIAGRPVIPVLGSSRAERERMYRVVQELAPEAKVGALAPRFVLASQIAAVLGSEMAQLAMADTFGMSPIPGYYSSLPEASVAEVIAEIQSRRFGEVVSAPANRTGWLGSRLTLTDNAARRWPEGLKKACQAAERARNPLAAWKAHRNHLVGSLCSATGHRPEDAVGRIHLADVIPEYGLIVLQDKQVDALRSARVAATGRLWLSDLRRYLDRLVDLARDRVGKPEGVLAAAILRSEEPLFSVADAEGQAVALTASELRASMPSELSGVDNFYRHRLNQCLQARRVDPELRHAQLGWVVTSAHFFAELSPRSPSDLGALLGPTIDEVLIADGWYVRSARKCSWTWTGVPMPEPRDWEADFQAAREQHQDNIKQVRARLKERWKEFEPAVLARMAAATREFCPQLELDERKRSLQWTEAHPRLVDLSADHHALICDRVRLGDQEPGSAFEAVIARILLYRMVRRARTRGIVRGPIPSRPILKVTSDASPFVPGLGVAVRHACLLRTNLQQRATRVSRDQGLLTVWTILAHSNYRREEWARAATGAASTLVRARSRRYAVRVAARTDEGTMPMVFSGVAAVMLARRKRDAPTSPSPSNHAVNAWAAKHLASGADWGHAALAGQRMQSALSATACVELSGIERLVAVAGRNTAAELPLRCVARDDAWPLRTIFDDSGVEAPARVEPGSDENDRGAPSTPGTRRDYGRFVALLNKRSFPTIRNQAKKARRATRETDSARSWRRALKAHLERLLPEVESQPNLHLLVGYALHHLIYGSEAGNQLEQRSLHREVTQIGWPLLVLVGTRRIAELAEEELFHLYQEVLLTKTLKGRPYVLEELRRFHHFLVRVHLRQPIEWGELASLAGPRQLSIQPALVTPSEVTAVGQALAEDYRQEVERPDASPEFLWLAQLRRLHFILLESSGIRPGSAYGLTLEDVHLLGSGGDYVHVRRGDYGEAKTDTSVGFVPLSGPLWQQNRQWVTVWLEEQKGARRSGQHGIPLFAARPASRTRVHEHHLTKRLNELLKWSTGNRVASCYWLRKTRISERFHELTERTHLTARDVYGALLVSGHAWIEVTVERYINDPCCLLSAAFERSSAAPRSALLAYSGLPGGAIDVAWSRASKHPYVRSEVLLDWLSVEVIPTPPEMRSTPPTLRRFKELRASHLDVYARALQEGASHLEAAMRAGVTQPQADAFAMSARLLFERRKLSPWRLTERHTAREVLAPPRRLDGTEAWFAQLQKATSPELLSLAETWASQPSASRLYGEDVIARIDRVDLQQVTALLDHTRIGAKVVERDGTYLLIAHMPKDANFGHVAAIQWVLALVWTHAKAVRGVSRDSVASAVHRPEGLDTCSA